METMSDTKERSEYFHRSHTSDLNIILPESTANNGSFHTYENDIDDTIARLYDMCKSNH